MHSYFHDILLRLIKLSIFGVTSNCLNETYLSKILCHFSPYLSIITDGSVFQKSMLQHSMVKMWKNVNCSSSPCGRYCCRISTHLTEAWVKILIPLLSERKALLSLISCMQVKKLWCMTLQQHYFLVRFKSNKSNSNTTFYQARR